MSVMGVASPLHDIWNLAVTGFDELIEGACNWRVWHLLGTKELRNRYMRSKLGQLWLTLSSAIMIGALGLMWSLLFKHPVHDLLPFFGVSVIMWNFMSQVLIECTAVLTAHSQFYRNQKMNFAVSIYSGIYKNTIIVGYNLIIIAILIAIFDIPVNWSLLQIIPAFILTCLMLLWVGYILAMACVRYRDLIQVVTNWMLLLFFLTPIMWRPDFLPQDYHFLIDCNPMAQFLELLRNPFLGRPASAFAWINCSAIAIGGALLALPIIGRYQRRVIYWM
jgi:ABC-type polysaccharide/polyol phosphate export permease